jgi:hypothetical protein
MFIYWGGGGGGRQLFALARLSHGQRPVLYRHTFPQIQMAPVTIKEIKEIIKSLLWKNSSGYDKDIIKNTKDKYALNHIPSYILMQQIHI